MCYKMLNKNGTLILQFPNINSLNCKVSNLSNSKWDMFLEQGHIFFPEKKHMTVFSNISNFKIINVKTSTITIRGKIPFWPIRNVDIENFIKEINLNSRVFNFFYLSFLKILDYFYLGDTVIYKLEKK